MSYCTRAQLDEALAPALLAQLTDDAAGVLADETIIAAMMAQADAVLDLYLGQAMTLPLTEPATLPPALERVAVQLTIYFLYLRRGLVDEARRDEYRSNLQLLSQVASGRIRVVTPETGTTCYFAL
jgi:phage gp36-like protein